MGRSLHLARFEQVYDDHARFVAAVLSRLGTAPASISDAVQDVFIVAYRHWPRFDDTRDPRPWLVGIARRVAFRHRRSLHRQQRKAHALRESSPSASPGLDGPVEARNFLRSFIGCLDDDLREVFVLAEIEGYTAPEIASQTGLTPAVVYRRLRLARKRLRKAVAIETQAPERTSDVPAFALLCARLPVPAMGHAVAGWGTAKLLAWAATATFGVAGMTLGARHAATRPANAVAPRHASVTVQATEKTSAPAAAPSVAVTSTVDPAPVSPMPRREAASARDPLAEEAALVRAATDWLARAEPSRALAALDEHARRFADGQLRDARQRHRIRALCDLGRTQEARHEAAAWLRARPDDPLARHSMQICDVAPRRSPPDPEN